jgi:four helix bundle protein
MPRQLLKSGTSIGANIEEASTAISIKEFIVKLQIAYKEARETLYWLRLFHETQLLTPQQFDSLKVTAQASSRIVFMIFRTSTRLKIYDFTGTPTRIK